MTSVIPHSNQFKTDKSSANTNVITSIHIQEEAYEANMQLPKLGLVLFTFGNVSAADRSLGAFAIKPTGVPYEELHLQKW